MDYQTFNNLHFRPLIKMFFHNIHIDLKDSSGEKIPFVSVGITHFASLFGKTSKICEGGDSVHSHKFLGELQFLSSVNISSQLHNGWVLTYYSLLYQKLEKLLVVQKFHNNRKIVARQSLRKQMVVVAGKGVQAESFQQNLQNKPVSREETFLQTILIHHVQQYLVPTFCGSFRNSWSESPSS